MPVFKLSLESGDTMLSPFGDGDAGLEAFEGVPTQIDTQDIVEPGAPGVDGGEQAVSGNPDGPGDEVGIFTDGDGGANRLTFEVPGIDEKDDDITVEGRYLEWKGWCATEPI